MGFLFPRLLDVGPFRCRGPRRGGVLNTTLCRNCWRITVSGHLRPRPLIELPTAIWRPCLRAQEASCPSAGGKSVKAGEPPHGRPVAPNDKSEETEAKEEEAAGRVPGSRQGSEGGEGERAQRQAEGEGEGEPPPSLGVRAALSMLAFYRNVLSPLMPSTCRFLPTCSVYSIEAYKKFGVTRGTVLTTWRLLRCNPWGGRGYDPPAWPPVGLAAVYDLPYTPEITVALGTALAWWFVMSTWESLVG